MRSQPTEIVTESSVTIFSRNGCHVTDEHQQILVILMCFVNLEHTDPPVELNSLSFSFSKLSFTQESTASDSLSALESQTLNDTSLLHAHAPDHTSSKFIFQAPVDALYSAALSVSYGSED